MTVLVTGAPWASEFLAHQQAARLGWGLAVLEKRKLRLVRRSGGGPRAILLTEAKKLPWITESFADAPQDYRVVLAVSSPELESLGVPEWILGEVQPKFVRVLPPARDLIKELTDSVYRPSVLQKLLTVFYRIKDLEERERAKNAAFAHLGGSPVVSGYPVVDSMLSDPLAVTLRSAIQRSMKVPVETACEELGVDSFDVRYIRARLGLERESV